MNSEELQHNDDNLALMSAELSRLREPIDSPETFKEMDEDSAGRRIDDYHLRRLNSLVRVTALAEAMTEDVIVELRARGVSFASIALELRVVESTAWRRFKHLDQTE